MRTSRALVALLVVVLVTAAMSATAGAVAPSNDNYDNFTFLNWDTNGGAHVWSVTNQTTNEATSETGEPQPLGGSAPSVWYLWSPSNAWDNQEFLVDNASQLVTLNVYTGSAVNALTLVTGDTDGIGRPFVSFAVTDNTPYWIRVASIPAGPTAGFDLVYGIDIRPPPVFGPSTVKVQGSKATVTFSASSTHTPVTYTCSLDNGSPNGCSSPYVAELAKGNHTLSLIATDQENVHTAPQNVPVTIKSGKIKS